MDVNLFEQDAGLGNENVGQEDLFAVFENTCGLSDELDNIEGAKPGMVNNTVSGELFSGKDGISRALSLQSSVLAMGTSWLWHESSYAIFTPGDVMPETKRQRHKQRHVDGQFRYIQHT